MKNHSWIASLLSWIDHQMNIPDIASASILITVSLFVLGGFLKWFWQFIGNMIVRAGVRSQFYLLMGHLTMLMELQAESYEKTVKSLDLKAEAPFYSGEVDFNDAAILKDIGYVTVFRSFFTGFENVAYMRSLSRRKKKEAFNQCWNGVASLAAMQASAKEHLKFFQDTYNRSADERYRELLAFDKFAYNTAAGFWGDPNAGPTREFFDKVLKIREEWAAAANNASPEVSQKVLVDPIMDMCSKSTMYHPHQVGFALMNVTAIYRNLHRLMATARVEFEQRAVYLRQLTNDVEAAKERLGKFRIKDK